MKLYWSPRTRAFRIAWLLEETGLPYERVDIDIRDETSRADPGFRRASPMGKVPAIEDGPVRLWDSGAIAVYLADAYPETGLGVAIGDPRRGAFHQWAMYLNSVIEPANGEKVRGDAANTLQNGFGSFELMLSTLEAGLADRPWLLGDHFSGPDVLVGSALHFMKIFGVLPEPPATLSDHLARCMARPAFARAAAMEAEA